MLIHHIVTILLLGFSYVSSFFRVGAVIVLVHDIADVFLEVILFSIPFLLPVKQEQTPSFPYMIHISRFLI